jgi:hypothetical protein
MRALFIGHILFPDDNISHKCSVQKVLSIASYDLNQSCGQESPQGEQLIAKVNMSQRTPGKRYCRHKQKRYNKQ